MVGRSVSRGVGFVVFAAMFLGFCTIVPIAALGAGQQLQVLWSSVDPRMVAVVIVVAGMILGIFNIKEAQWFAALFLVFQLVAIAIVVVLGVMHWHDPVSRLLTTEAFAPDGSAIPWTASAVIFAISFGWLTMFGYGTTAVILSEETKDPRRKMPRLVLISLGVIGVTLLVTTAAIQIGAPSLKELSLAPNAVAWFVETLGNGTLGKIVSSLVFLALAEASMMLVLMIGRMLWSSARDNTWPTPVSKVLASLQPRFKSPWVATTLFGLICIGVVFIDLGRLIEMQVVITLLTCGLMALGALLIRSRKSVPAGSWRMPLWPLAPIIVLVYVVAFMTKQTRYSLIITGVVVVVAIVYYVGFLMTRPKTHFVLDAPEAAGSSEPGPMAETGPAPAAE
jgi:amino acid transporter